MHTFIHANLAHTVNYERWLNRVWNMPTHNNMINFNFLFYNCFQCILPHSVTIFCYLKSREFFFLFAFPFHTYMWDVKGMSALCNWYQSNIGQYLGAAEWLCKRKIWERRCSKIEEWTEYRNWLPMIAKWWCLQCIKIQKLLVLQLKTKFSHSHF